MSSSIDAAAHRGDGGAGALPPLSDRTLAEFRSDTVGPIWNELLVLARQPGVGSCVNMP